MAFDAFILIDGIDGESGDDSHSGWMEVKNFSLGAAQRVSGTASSNETMIYIHKWLIVMTALSGVVDCFLTATIRRKKIKVDNRYLRIQRRYGIKPLTISKTLSILVLSYFLLNPPANAGAVGAIALTYCLIVVILIMDFIRGKFLVNLKR